MARLPACLLTASILTVAIKRRYAEAIIHPMGRYMHLPVPVGQRIWMERQALDALVERGFILATILREADDVQYD